VHVERDARLDEEASRFGLRRHCEDCALYDPAADRCAHGYPTTEHRRRAGERLVVFCKDFECA
jgi:hypothetical protein